MANENILDIALHNKQAEAFFSKATEILYGGAAGGGKSHLMRVAAINWCSEIDGLQVYIFRRVSEDLYKNHMEGAGGFFSLLGGWISLGLANYNSSKNVISFWNGSKIWLCHCQYEKDKFKYQGAEIHVLMIDELTHFTESIYRYLRGRCRMGSLDIPDKYTKAFPRILCGSNPSGLGHTWVKNTFVDNAPYKDVVRMPRDEGGMLRQYIPALLTDNPTLNYEEYSGTLSGLGSPDLVKAMLNGDWNIVAGGALDDLWRSDTHIIPRFKVPFSWRLDRSFDWGSSTPFSVGWWAEANGEEAELEDGTTFCPPKGTLVRIAEWYGAEKVGTNKGLGLTAKEIALGIIEMEKQLLDLGWINGKVNAGVADNQISNVIEKRADTIEKKMADEKVYWLKSNKSAGSRIVGLDLIRSRMKAAIAGEGAAIYFTNNCLASIATLPIMGRDPNNPEDVLKGADDHAYDEIRYRVLHGNVRSATKINIRHVT
tara:strand:- start:721 stop:2172 length:1452 start_codon:yes stop_codon:yes gene_type:complete